MTEEWFAKFFKEGTGFEPYPYQCRLASGTEDGKAGDGVECESRLIHVPTGAGKTEAVVMAWLWNRVCRNDSRWPLFDWTCRWWMARFTGRTDR